MASYLQVFDGSALADPIVVSLGPGDTSATYSRQVWNDKAGAEGADTAAGLRIVLEAYNAVLGSWVRRGMPILDELWCSLRITSVTNTGDATFGPYSTGTKRIGANCEFETPDLPANCAFNVALSVFGPATIDTTAIELRLVAVDAENSKGLADKTGLLGSGILPGWRDAALRKIVTGFRVTASGTASVSVSAGIVDFDGVRACGIVSSHTLNQNDSAAAALALGQSYKVTISVDASGVVTATKGTKAVSPTAPAVPTDEIFVAYVTVDYQGGGTSVIDQADVDDASAVHCDYDVLAGAGLTVEIHSGSGVSTTSHYQFHGVVNVLSLAASDTSYIWRRPDGTFEDELLGVAPEDGSELLAEVDTDGSGVTAIRDRRVYLTAPLTDYMIALRKSGAINATATYCDWSALPFDAELVDVTLEVGDKGTSASGSFQVDVNTIPAGTSSTSGTRTTIYTSQGTENHLPTVAYNAAVARDVSYFHEVRRFSAGTRFSFDVDAVPGTISVNPTDLYVYLRFRRYR